MATFDGIIPELAKAGFIKKVNDLRYQISTLQQEIDTLSESTKTMFWSNSIPSDLGTVGELQSFSVQVKAYSLIDVPPTYSVIAGSLPSGLTLNPINGYITGVVGNYETITPCVFTVQAADNQTTITKQFTITVNAVNDAPTWITASELGDMTVDFISIQLSVNDPDSTPTFTIVDGSLPSGVTLSSSGLISGTNPRDNLTYTFTVEANDGTNQVQRQFTFVAFNEAPVWVTDGDLGTITGSVFSKSLSATDNDSASLTYSVNPLSALPEGVSLSNSGVLSGTNPLTNTTHTFDIDVSDGVNVITRTFFFYAYNEAPVWVTNASLGSFDTPTISIQLSATDAENESLTYAVVAGSLPNGLTLTSSGLISGNNPFDGLTSSFTIAVSDKANSVNREFSITCEVAAGEAIYTSVGNYSFTVPAGVREIDALVVAGGSGITSVGNVKATKGSTDTPMNPRYSFPGTVQLASSCKGSAGVVVGSVDGNLYRIDMDTRGVLKGNNVLGISGVRKIIFYKNKYYSFSGTKIASSGDGLTWVLFNSNVPITDVWDVFVDTGIIIAVGAGGKIIYSLDDMNTWVSTPSGFGTSTIYSIIKGNGVYVAAGDVGKVSTSPDGITWTARSTGMTRSVGISAIFTNGTFILSCFNNLDGAESNALISTDGISWSISATIPYMSAVVYSPLFGFFGVNGNYYYKSLDGVTWVKKYYALSGSVANQFPNSISFWDNNIIIASGYASSYGYVFHSTDGGSTLYNIHATSFGSLSPGSISGASYRKDGKLLALWSSSSAFCVSKNDLTMPLMTYNGTAITNVTSVASNADDSVVVVGTMNTGSGHEVSTDGGFSWTPIYLSPYNRTGWVGKTGKFYFFNGVWIALIVSDSSYAFYTSPDLISWTGYGTPSSGNITAKLVNNVFFVETNGGNFYTTDGLSWTPTPSGFSPVGFYNGKYYQYGTTSTIKYTTDISSSFTSVNVTALIGGTANLSNLYMTDNGQFILVNSSAVTTVTGYYLTTDLVSSSRFFPALHITPVQTYDGKIVAYGTTITSTGTFKALTPTPRVVQIYEKLNTPSSTVVATTHGLLKIWKNGYEPIDVCSPMIYSMGNIASSGDTVYQLTNYGVFSYNVSSGVQYYYPVNATYSSPRDIVVFNNFILATYGGGTYIRIDLTTKALTVSSVGYNYMSYTIFNGELFAVAAPTSGTNGTPIIKTTDGITWKTVYTTTTAGNLFIKESTLCHYASGSSTMTTSIDGTNWTTTATTGNTYSSITYNNGTWALATSNYIKYSTDLVTWYTVTLTQLLGTFTLIEKADIPDTTAFIAYSSYDEKVVFTLVPKGTSNTDATLTRPSTEGFSLTNPNDNGNYGKLSGIAGYKNNIPVNPNDTINVSVPSLDGAVRIIWGGGRDFPNNAV